MGAAPQKYPPFGGLGAEASPTACAPVLDKPEEPFRLGVDRLLQQIGRQATPAEHHGDPDCVAAMLSQPSIVDQSTGSACWSLVCLSVRLSCTLSTSENEAGMTSTPSQTTEGGVCEKLGPVLFGTWRQLN